MEVQLALEYAEYKRRRAAGIDEPMFPTLHAFAVCVETRNQVDGDKWRDSEKLMLAACFVVGGTVTSLATIYPMTGDRTSNGVETNRGKIFAALAARGFALK